MCQIDKEKGKATTRQSVDSKKMCQVGGNRKNRYNETVCIEFRRTINILNKKQ